MSPIQSYPLAWGLVDKFFHSSLMYKRSTKHTKRLRKRNTICQWLLLTAQAIILQHSFLDCPLHHGLLLHLLAGQHPLDHVYPVVVLLYQCLGRRDLNMRSVFRCFIQSHNDTFSKGAKPKMLISAKQVQNSSEWMKIGRYMICELI